MPRPFTRAQALENRAFLAALARTGNAHEAARAIGAHRSRFTRRRAKHPAFAAEWDAAVALAHAALLDSRRHGEGGAAGPRRAASAEPTLHRTALGRLQLRRPGGGRRLTRATEQAFLAALSATANVRLSAAAAGFSHSAFYARRKQSPAFAREMRLALQIGYDRIEEALLASFLPGSHADDAWRRNDPPPIPPMTANQALQLLYLHQKEARLWSEPDYLKRRRGESREAWSLRLAAMYEARRQREREAFDVAEVERRAARGGPSPFEPAPPVLPALEQVMSVLHAASCARRETGADRPAGREASPSDDAGFTPASGAVYHEGVALFGGWRLGDWRAG